MTDNLQEISKKIVGKYLKVASDRKGGHDYMNGAAHVAGMAAEKDGRKSDAKHNNAMSDKQKGYAARRKKGINMGIDKLSGAARQPATEEVEIAEEENLTEISDKLRKSYVKAASKDIGSRHKDISKKLNSKRPTSANRDIAKNTDRLAHVGKAAAAKPSREGLRSKIKSVLSKVFTRKPKEKKPLMITHDKPKATPAKPVNKPANRVAHVQATPAPKKSATPAVKSVAKIKASKGPLVRDEKKLNLKGI